MKLIIITGLSGAGKSRAIQSLEDMGYFCIDNMPPQLLLKFIELYRSNENAKGIAIVCDIRSGSMFSELSNSLDELTASGYSYDLLFLEASDETLIKRYKETRRTHPLSKNKRIIDGILKEREILSDIRSRATHILDTTMLSGSDLSKQIVDIYKGSKKFDGLIVNIMSFGFKNGIPLDSDLVFDVRFLPNPFYIPKLKNRTGLEKCVYEYVMDFKISYDFLNKLTDMVNYLIPHYIEEGKTQLVISIGCTGGKHRSVTIAEALKKELKNGGHNALTIHRDIKKG